MARQEPRTPETATSGPQSAEPAANGAPVTEPCERAADAHTEAPATRQLHTETREALAEQETNPMAEQHTPAAFYWNADTDHCPHKPQPERGTDAWDEWMCNHQMSDDGPICLDAPAGDACPACSAEHGDMVPWGRCENREHARPRQAKTQQHRPVIADVGGLECLERDCDDFFTDDGDEIPGKTTCSHMRQMEICDACSGEPTAGNEYPAVVAWADCPQRKAEAAQR